MTMTVSPSSDGLKVVIVGGGIGGLACAVACRRRANPPLHVTVLERTPEILTIGAGIHIPPNGCRVLANFGLLDKLKTAGGYEIEDFVLRRYEDGKVLVEKPIKGRMEKEYKAKWMYVSHRVGQLHVIVEILIRLIQINPPR